MNGLVRLERLLLELRIVVVVVIVEEASSSAHGGLCQERVQRGGGDDEKGPAARCDASAKLSLVRSDSHRLRLSL